MDDRPNVGMIVGIDPGLKGGIAFLRNSKVEIHDMPTMPNPKGKEELDLFALGSILRPLWPWGGRNVAVLEKVHAMPKQGLSSTFRFGEGYGALQMALIGHGYELHYVTPAVWKRHFGLSADKGVSRGLASRRFPESASQFTRVKDDGRAEAALLAVYGFDRITNPNL